MNRTKMTRRLVAIWAACIPGLASGFSQRVNAQSEHLVAASKPKNQFPYVATSEVSSELSYDPSAFPRDLPLQQVQGGNTRLTFKMPLGADRVQMVIKSNGRPLKARVELWCGPIRRTHFLDMDVMNGQETPVRACLKFKNTDSAGPQTLQINTKQDSTFPALVGVDVLSAERSKERQAHFDNIWKASTKIYSQGDKTVRSIPIADHVRSVQLLVWSKDVGKKSFKISLELLQGPNTKRQYFELQCGGGSQPYHAVFETPGHGWTLRLKNNKTVHDGSFECVLVPFELEQDQDAHSALALSPYSGGISPYSTFGGNYGTSLGPHGKGAATYGSTGSSNGYTPNKW